MIKHLSPRFMISSIQSNTLLYSIKPLNNVIEQHETSKMNWKLTRIIVGLVMLEPILRWLHVELHGRFEVRLRRRSIVNLRWRGCVTLLVTSAYTSVGLDVTWYVPLDSSQGQRGDREEDQERLHCVESRLVLCLKEGHGWVYTTWSDLTWPRVWELNLGRRSIQVKRKNGRQVIWKVRSLWRQIRVKGIKKLILS